MTDPQYIGDDWQLDQYENGEHYLMHRYKDITIFMFPTREPTVDVEITDADGHARSILIPLEALKALLEAECRI